MDKRLFIRNRYFLMLLIPLVGLVNESVVLAQGAAFTYQGRLTDSVMPANGNYDMQFKLFDTQTVGTGTQQGATITIATVLVTNGIFKAQLDFGALVFDGSVRFLEIGVRPSSASAYTTLAPRQAVTSTPYTIRSLSAASADTATNATQLGGLGASGFIQNTAMQQAATNFNISGNGTLAGTLSANMVNTATQYNLGGTRALGISGSVDCPNCNTFVGASAGLNTTTGSENSFFGVSAGQAGNGSHNSHFGAFAGENNTAWNSSFFGAFAGRSNTTGSFNSFFGKSAGEKNTTGDLNSFFGANSGFNNSTGSRNTYFGAIVALGNSTGSDNSFFGNQTGFTNSTGSFNSFFGGESGYTNTTANHNSFYGYFAGNKNSTGDDNSFFGSTAGQNNSTGADNAFFGRSAGINNTTASNNSFFGSAAGLDNTTGFDNSFLGRSAGRNNTTGANNAFFGANAGYFNTTAGDNAFFGSSAGQNNTAGGNSFFGSQAGFDNTTGCCNAFFGTFTGSNNTTGEDNAFFGRSTGITNTTGSRNTFMGRAAGAGNSVGSDNTFLGYGSAAGALINNATAIGSRSQVSQSNSLVLGSIDGINGATETVNVGIGTTAPQDRLHVNGIIRVISLGAGGATALCRNASNQISTCSSSLRYKEQVQPLHSGLEVIERLRPITFTWKQSGERDLGLAAEQVFEVEPLLATHNGQGQIEGVKYEQLSVVLINAVQQQQEQIKQQQRLIDSLVKTVCAAHPKAQVCQLRRRAASGVKR
jgi:hypothetical protein